MNSPRSESCRWFAEEVQPHEPALRAFLRQRFPEVQDADDLVQETILKAWSNMDKFDPKTNLDAWLFTILRNTFYSSLRKTRREVQDTDGWWVGQQGRREHGEHASGSTHGGERR